MHNYDADSEACLNRQILNNSVKRKAMADLCERPRKLIHKAFGLCNKLLTLICSATFGVEHFATGKFLPKFRRNIRRLFGK